jgi:hypothetical protein
MRIPAYLKALWLPKKYTVPQFNSALLPKFQTGKTQGTFGLLADPVNPSNEGEGSSTCGHQSTAPKNTPQKIA